MTYDYMYIKCMSTVIAGVHGHCEKFSRRSERYFLDFQGVRADFLDICMVNMRKIDELGPGVSLPLPTSLQLCICDSHIV